MNQMKAAAEAALWSAVWDENGYATATSGDAGSSGGSPSGAHADAAGDEADLPAVATAHGSPIVARTGRRVPTRAEARFPPSPTSLRDRSKRAEALQNARAAGSSAAGSSAGSSSAAGASGTSAGSSAQTAPPSSTTASAQIAPASLSAAAARSEGKRVVRDRKVVAAGNAQTIYADSDDVSETETDESTGARTSPSSATPTTTESSGADLSSRSAAAVMTATTTPPRAFSRSCAVPNSTKTTKNGFSAERTNAPVVLFGFRLRLRPYRGLWTKKKAAF